MISLKKMFLFVHVPKTGGNSLQNILKEYSEDRLVTPAPYQDGVERFEVRNDRYDITKHSTLTRYQSVLDPSTYRQLFKFAVIRNPWDRMVSHYFSPHRGVTEYDREDFLQLIGRLPTLRHYVCETSLLNRALKKIGIHSHIGHRSLDGDLDCLIRFEQLEEGFALVCRRLDIPFQSLPKRNASRRSHYSHYYDDELRAAVERRFAEEIEYGEYTFERD